MTARPKLELSRLRAIGWMHWDPIGLSDGRALSVAGFDDEYDAYLLHAVSMLCAGSSRKEAADYLVGVVSDQMELSVVDRGAAVATIDAIAAYLATLPDGPKSLR